ncbi:response regulator transcription factor [Gordonia sp. 'Campus']|uniref:LuxR C-terminal-related transcriptional regulator n=1 Tax=Gordonia sp. 'Campus' TaxID=2915824 RepID=UPI001EE44E2F|nr:response regulator transcription factor [Gordonia sp. 'Campus']
MAVRVVLADDDVLLREGLASLLTTAGFDVVGRAGDAEDLLTVVAEAILVLSAHVDVDQALELLESGRGIGYLLKTRVTDVDDFVDTVHRIAGGATVMDPALVHELVAARRRNDPLEVLSAREREVLTLMAEGLSNAGIGRRLWITEGTVEKHVRSILTKFDLADTADDHRRVRAVILFLDATA